MINRRNFLGVGSGALVMATAGRSEAKIGAKTGVLLMNRIAPSSSDIYVANPDGVGERRFLQTPGFDYNASFSTDGRSPNLVANVTSQIVSVDVITGERLEHTSGSGLKVYHQFLSRSEIGYLRKGGVDEGIFYTSGRPGFKRAVRAPAWSLDGKMVIYEKHVFDARPQNKLLYGWDRDWEYRHSDVFPALARDGTLAYTEK
jgi:hypothetical protein